jgi:hypothetical protein
MTPLLVTTLPAEAGASGDATAARGATMVLMRRFEDACFGMFAEVILQEVVKLRIQNPLSARTRRRAGSPQQNLWSVPFHCVISSPVPLDKTGLSWLSPPYCMSLSILEKQ